MKTGKTRRIASLLLTIVMLIGLLPTGVMANETQNQITIDFTAYDGVNQKFLFVPNSLTVTAGIASENNLDNSAEYVQEGEISALDALVAAHLEVGRPATDITSASYTTGMFGQRGANISFAVNNLAPIDDMSRGYAINEAVLQDGDNVIFFIYGDEYWGDYLSYFDQDSLSVTANEEFTLNLKGHSFMEQMWGNPGNPTPEITSRVNIAEAGICLVDAETGELGAGLEYQGVPVVTDENGNFTYAFSQPGEYILTATGLAEGMMGEVPIVAPFCRVTVTGTAETTPVSVEDATVSVLNYLKETVPSPTVGTSGGEWAVLALARGGMENSAAYKVYIENVKTYLTENVSDDNKLHSRKLTENSRVIIGLSALGVDSSALQTENGKQYNLTAPLNVLDDVTWQGINGPIYALIAMDTHHYAFADNATGSRGAFIDYIMEQKIASGGWALFGSSADPDITAMTLQALAPYYLDEEKFNAAGAKTNYTDFCQAVNVALDALSTIQNEQGGFGSWGSVNAESCAQVLCALTALEIDPAQDSRFIKNDNTVIDALLSFRDDATGGFMHVAESSVNQMATEQAAYALVAYQRFVNKQPSLYDMSDVDFGDVPEPDGPAAVYAVYNSDFSYHPARSNRSEFVVEPGYAKNTFGYTSDGLEKNADKATAFDLLTMVIGKVQLYMANNPTYYLNLAEDGTLTQFDQNPVSSNRQPYVIINGVCQDINQLDEVILKENDEIYILHTKGAQGNYVLPWFEDESGKILNTLQVQAEEDITLVLKGVDTNQTALTNGSPLAGVAVGVCKSRGNEAGKFTQIEDLITDEAGKVTLSFSESGTYYLTAQGSATIDAENYRVLAPQVAVIVEKNDSTALSNMVLSQRYQGGAVGYSDLFTLSGSNDSHLYCSNAAQAVDDDIRILGDVAPGATVTIDGTPVPVDENGAFSAPVPCDNPDNSKTYYEIKTLKVTSPDGTVTETYPIWMCYGTSTEGTQPVFTQMVDENGNAFAASHAMGPTTNSIMISEDRFLTAMGGHSLTMQTASHVDTVRMAGAVQDTVSITGIRARRLSDDGTLEEYIDGTVNAGIGSSFITGSLPLEPGFNFYIFEVKISGNHSWKQHGAISIWRTPDDSKSNNTEIDISKFKFTDAAGNVLTPAALQEPAEDPNGTVYWEIKLPAGTDQNAVYTELLENPDGGKGSINFNFGQPMTVGNKMSTTLSVSPADLYRDYSTNIRLSVVAENKICSQVYQIRVTRAAMEPTAETATAITKPNIMTLNSAGGNQTTNILVRRPGENPLLPNGGQIGFSLQSVDLSTEPDPTTLFISAAVSPQTGQINANFQSQIASIRLNPELLLASRGATYSIVVNETQQIANHVKSGPFLIPHTGGYNYGKTETNEGINATLIWVFVHAPEGMDFPDRKYTFIVPKIASDTADFSNVEVLSGSMYNFMTGEGKLTVPGKEEITGFLESEHEYEIQANYNVDKIVFYPTVNNADPKSIQCTVNGSPVEVKLDGMGKMRAITDLKVGENTITLTGSSDPYIFKVVRGESYNVKPPVYQDGVVAAGKYSPTRDLYAIAESDVTQVTATFAAENPERTVTVTEDGKVLASAKKEVTVTLDAAKTAVVKISDDEGGYKEYKSYIRKRHMASPSKTYAFLPAPGQFTNEQAQTVTGVAGGFGWGEGWDGSLYATDEEINSSAGGSGGISLGGFGGYVIYQFDDPIKNGPNNKYGADFMIRGNAFIGNNEPAGVMVAQDEDNDGKPDKWYNLAGSEHYEDTTDWNYEVTYTNPNPSFVPNIGENVPWTDNRGNSGQILYNGFHRQIYYPNPNTIGFEGNAAMEGFDAEKMTFSGVNINKLEVGFGYVDTCSYDRNATVVKGNPYANDFTAFDIAWAVDENGELVQLDDITYLKIYTCQQTDGGSVGEKSPEILLVSRLDQGTEVVGKTDKPSGIQIIPTNGAAPTEVVLEEGKTVYELNLGEVRNVNLLVKGAPNDRIYINNQKVEAGEQTQKAYSIEAGKTRQIRVVVQNGEKEPYICLLNLTGTAKKVLTDLKLERNGTNIALTPDGDLKYTAKVRYSYDSIDVIPTAKDGAAITVNGQPLTDGKASVELTANAVTEIIVQATLDGETETTTILVTRPGSSGGSGSGGDTEIPGFGDKIGKVDVYVENTTFADGAFTGDIVSERRFDFAENDTMMTVVLRALAENGYGWTGTGGSKPQGVDDYEIDYLASITKDGKTLGEFSGSPQSGWMGTLNDWFVNEGFQQFELEDGDEIRVMFTQNLGMDLGGSWENSDTSLRLLRFSEGTLSPSFDSAVTDYTLTLPSGTKNVKVTPTASNKNYLVKTFLNEQVKTNEEGASYFKRTQNIPVEDGDIIYIGVGEPAWPSMNNQGEEARDYEPTWYAVEIDFDGKSTGRPSGSGSGSSGGNPNVTVPPTTDPAEPGTDIDASPFTDIADHWAKDMISYAFKNGLMKGVSETEFDPDGVLSRAMLVTVLYRMAGMPETAAETIFSDVPADSWYNKAVLWASENGIVNGYGDGIFGPDDTITREQLAAIFYRYADSPEISGMGLDEFADANAISDYAKSSMLWAVQNGIINGKGDGIIDPAGNATRAETATIFYRYLEKAES